MEGFDLKVHHRDPKTGAVTKATPYRMVVSKDHGTRFHRDGIEYYPDGSRVTPLPVEKQEEKKVEAPVKAKAQSPDILAPEQPFVDEEEVKAETVAAPHVAPAPKKAKGK